MRILLIALVGGILSAAALVMAWRAQSGRDDAEFERQIALFLGGFQERRNGIEDLLRTLRAVFNQNPALSRQQFHDTIQDLSIRLEGIQALVWAPRVTREHRDDVEQAVRQEGYGDFRITEGDLIHFPEERPQPATARPEYLPVMFLEPYAGNEHVLGYDLASVPEVRAALTDARDSGDIRVSASVRILYQGAIVPGLVAAIPVYSPALKPATVEDRQRQSQGCVLGVLILPELLERLVARIPRFQLDVVIVDLTTPEGRRVLQAHAHPRPAGQTKIPSEAEFRQRPLREVLTSVGRRRWALLFRRNQDWKYGPRYWPPLSLLGCGLLFTSLVVQRLQASRRRTIQVEQLVKRRTAELADANTRLQTEVQERAQVQDQLAKDRNLLRTLIDRLPDSVFVTDLEGRYLRMNEAHRWWLELEREADGVGRPVGAVGPAPLRERLAAGVDQVLRSGEPLLNREETFAGNPGAERVLLVSELPLRGADGKVEGLVGLVRDVTGAKHAEAERLELEHRLRETQKLESLGVLAGGIAHDFNNLLTSVLGNVGLARADLPVESPACESLDQVESTAIRAADLCKQLLAYSGKGRFVVRRLDLGAFVQETTELLRLSISKRVRLHLDLARDLPVIQGDPTQLRQILMNLVINASEAIGERSGQIWVRTRLCHLSQSELETSRLVQDSPPGDYVALEVSDDGCGMDPETLRKIFDPFFTTKFTGRGLGLAAVLGIVRGHRGTIQVESQPGRGTTFRLLLPPAVGLADAETVSAPAAGWKGSGTLLLVDDEPSVRRVAGRILEQAGFSVDVAEDGREALRRFTAAPDRYRAVLLDLTMPHMDGQEAFRELRRLRPEVRVLLMSGFSPQEAGERFAGQGLDAFLQKPFGTVDLQNAVRQLLES